MGLRWKLPGYPSSKGSEENKEPGEETSGRKGSLKWPFTISEKLEGALMAPSFHH